jgi:hypothetical protein
MRVALRDGRLIATALSVAAVVACSTGSGPVASGVTAAQACADNAQQRCLRLQACSPTDVALRYGSETDCETRETTDCTDSLAEPLAGNTAAAVEACAGAYAAWACDEYLTGQNPPAACRQQLGPIANGGPCAIDGQCQTGFCAIAPGASCGTCTNLPKPGMSCSGLTSCGPALTCTRDTLDCVSPAARGAACGKGAPCAIGLTCVGADASPGATGTCEASGESAGVACDPLAKSGPGCDRNAGLACGGTSKSCEAVGVAAAGQPCGADVGGQTVLCAAEGVCTGAGGSNPGTCTAAAADGDACDAVHGPGCILPARCVGSGGTAGTCQYSGAQACGG